MTLNNKDNELDNSIGSSENNVYNKELYGGDVNICHYCLSLISSTTLKCPHCGEWISDYPHDDNICSSCHEKIPWGALKCMHCGSWVHKVEKDINDIAEEEIKHEVDELVEHLNHNL